MRAEDMVLAVMRGQDPQKVVDELQEGWGEDARIGAIGSGLIGLGTGGVVGTMRGLGQYRQARKAGATRRQAAKQGLKRLVIDTGIGTAAGATAGALSPVLGMPAWAAAEGSPKLHKAMARLAGVRDEGNS